MAKEKGWRWEDGRLAAKQLFDALDACGIPLDRCMFRNWFEKGQPEQVRRHRGPVVAMGNKVQDAMTAAGVSFIAIIHPAARGRIRKKDRYAAHVAEQLQHLVTG